jgi:hypothetical protein
MSILKTKTWADNEGVNYDDMNANFDTLYAKLNGNIENEDIKASAGIVESKIAFNTSSGHSHNGTDSKLITINRAFTWTILGTLATGNNQGAQYIVPQNMTVVKIWGKCSASNVQVRVRKNGSNIKSGFEVGSTVTSSTSFTSTSLTAGDVLTFDITGVNGATDVFITLECKQP